MGDVLKNGHGLLGIGQPRSFGRLKDPSDLQMEVALTEAGFSKLRPK